MSVDDLPAAPDAGLPGWAVVTAERRAHVERVVALLDDWAARLALPTAEHQRWRSAGWLHDALRDAPESELRRLAGAPPAVPLGLLHGPAAAARARAEGFRDSGVLEAVAYHTVGYADWEPVGVALYAADFLEPGRPFAQERRRDLADRFPIDRDAVVREVVAMRVAHELAKDRLPTRESARFRAAWGD